jgi:hypothetical protein
MKKKMVMNATIKVLAKDFMKICSSYLVFDYLITFKGSRKLA